MANENRFLFSGSVSQQLSALGSNIYGPSGRNWAPSGAANTNPITTSGTPWSKSYDSAALANIKNQRSYEEASGTGGPVNSPSTQWNLDDYPTAQMEIDPLSFRTISYPENITNHMENGHYMIFYVNVQNKTKYRYTGVDGKTVGGKVEVAKKEWVKAVYEVQPGSGKTLVKKGYMKTNYTYEDAKTLPKNELDYAEGLIQKGGQGNVNNSNRIHLTPNVSDRMGGLSSVHNTTTRITDSIALYLPPNVKDTTAATYAPMTTGIVGLVAAGGGAFLDAMRRNDYEAASKSLVGGVKAITQAALQKIGGEFVDMIAGVEGSADLANKAFGQATNPYMEVIFDKMNPRVFSYNFTFAPRNKKETEDVQRIIQLFRFHMAPELKGAQHRFLTLPSTFDIHYMYQVDPENAYENSFYTKIATCVLDGVDVDYTPNAVKSFQDGAPTQISMVLSFQETELITKEKVNAGY